MKYTTALVGICAVMAVANPTPNATSDLAERFNVDDSLKTSIQNANPDALQDLSEGMCSQDAGDGPTAGADKPKTLEEILLWIWCGQCREQYQKCMNVSLAVHLEHLAHT